MFSAFAGVGLHNCRVYSYLQLRWGRQDIWAHRSWSGNLWTSSSKEFKTVISRKKYRILGGRVDNCMRSESPRSTCRRRWPLDVRKFIIIKLRRIEFFGWLIWSTSDWLFRGPKGEINSSSRNPIDMDSRATSCMCEGDYLLSAVWNYSVGLWIIRVQRQPQNLELPAIIVHFL